MYVRDVFVHIPYLQTPPQIFNEQTIQTTFSLVWLFRGNFLQIEAQFQDFIKTGKYISIVVVKDSKTILHFVDMIERFASYYKR